MAIQDVQKFLLALEQDESLAVQVDDAYVEALHGVASGAGFEFSEDELRAGLDAAAGDLSDEELEHVMGGYTSTSLSRDALSAQLNTAPGGFTADTVYGGGTSSHGLINPAPMRFSSFSKTGYSR
ncbi:MAG: Nif11-like leader peptide family natural product precursor [Gammaproteobacteria bacterium]|nr:Nif11-like leader peptide family natural product precursor [Gammaproteobacteria bacterium]